MPRRSPLILSLQGRVETTDLLAIGERLSHTRRPKLLLVLFDWSEIASWAFRPPSLDELRGWLAAAKLVGRIVILHHRAFDRQAAWLAALLRARGCSVRSYRPDDCDRARRWLTDDLDGSFPRVERLG